MGLFSRWWRSQDVAASVEAILDSRLRETVTSLNSVASLSEEKMRLTEELVRLREEKANIQSEMERERLAVEHKLGLEAMRQEQEYKIEVARTTALRESLVGMQEVAVEKARLEAQTEAVREAREKMEEFTDRQEKMITQLLDALPTAKMFGTNQ